MSFYFTNSSWLLLAVLIVPIIWRWRKLKPSTFLIGGFFGESQQQVDGNETSNWPAWWLWLLACSTLAVLALSQPLISSVQESVGGVETPFIISAAPMSASTARAQVIDSELKVSMRQLKISDNKFVQLPKASSDWQYFYFAEVAAVLPSSVNKSWLNLFKATWPLIDIKFAQQALLTVNGNFVDLPTEIVWTEQPNSAQTAEFIHLLRSSVSAVQKPRDYSKFLGNNTNSSLKIFQFDYWLAIASAVCGLMSVVVFSRR